MKNGIVNIWLLGLVVVFIALFSAFIIVNINYSKSFKIKNEVLSIIEKHKGIISQNTSNSSGKSVIVDGATITTNVNTIQTINLYLMGNAYDAMGYCPTEDDTPGTWYGVSSLSDDAHTSISSDYELADENKKYYYCFAKYKANNQKGKYKSSYYKVRLFYKFEVPVLDNFLSVKVEGTSDEVYDPQDEKDEPIHETDFIS